MGKRGLVVFVGVAGEEASKLIRTVGGNSIPKGVKISTPMSSSTTASPSKPEKRARSPSPSEDDERREILIAWLSADKKSAKARKELAEAEAKKKDLLSKHAFLGNIVGILRKKKKKTDEADVEMEDIASPSSSSAPSAAPSAKPSHRASIEKKLKAAEVKPKPYGGKKPDVEEIRKGNQ